MRPVRALECGQDLSAWPIETDDLTEINVVPMDSRLRWNMTASAASEAP